MFRLRTACVPVDRVASSFTLSVRVESLRSCGYRGYGTKFTSVGTMSATVRNTDTLRASVPGAASLFRRASSMNSGVSATMCMTPSQLRMQRRWQTEEKKAEDGKKAEGAEEGKPEGEAAEGEAKEEPKGFAHQLNLLKQDFKEFPEIYNAVSLINFFLFTIFCLCSTGSNVEEKWWLNNWGIDADVTPWAWPLHSLHMNNFMSMAFAMMLVHSMGHSVVTHIGGQGLLTYCSVISVVSGILMGAFNYAIDKRDEKQFGPWDFIAGLFVMQYLHQGFKPWQIINGFHGWVKYACMVGSVSILYFDWQPVACGTVLGLILCKTKFPAPIAKP